MDFSRLITMNSDSNEMKKRLVHQIAEDFYSRFESNEQKVERLRRLQQKEVSLPQGLEVEGEVRIPEVSEMHTMLLRGMKARIGTPEFPLPEESRTSLEESRKKELEGEASEY